MVGRMNGVVPRASTIFNCKSNTHPTSFDGYLNFRKIQQHTQRVYYIEPKRVSVG